MRFLVIFYLILRSNKQKCHFIRLDVLPYNNYSSSNLHIIPIKHALARAILLWDAEAMEYFLFSSLLLGCDIYSYIFFVRMRRFFFWLNKMDAIDISCFVYSNFCTKTSINTSNINKRNYFFHIWIFMLIWKYFKLLITIKIISTLVFTINLYELIMQEKFWLNYWQYCQKINKFYNFLLDKW